MITPDNFPYLTSIHVNDCYTYKDFDIPLGENKPFNNLILTGKNGSGKSTILKALNSIIEYSTNNKIDKKKEALDYSSSLLDPNLPIEIRENFINFSKETKENLEHIWDFSKINTKFSKNEFPFYFQEKNNFIFTYLTPNRDSKVYKVNAPSNLDNFKKQQEIALSKSDFFIRNFKQYLVNKKVNQAFAQLEEKKSEIKMTDLFFTELENIFRKIFEDDNLKFIFEKEKYEFFFVLTDGRKLTLDILPDGISAFLSILMDLLVRLDLIRNSLKDNSYEPCGVVLIDEPENHLHLSLQYQVLPILTTFFPNIQFILATHSPAVISSIKNVTIFDLTSKETLNDEAVGKSFSELMVSHFGLDNEFSDISDNLFDKFNEIMKDKNIDYRNQRITKLMKENEKYISPVMRFELEAKLSD